MEDLSLHILDIAENSIRANATRVAITLIEDQQQDRLTLEIRDDGEGMDKTLVTKAQDPFFTSKKGKAVGLGIPLLAQAAWGSGGSFSLDSRPGKGTVLKAVLRISHPDCLPVGDVEQTVEVLRVSHPDIDFVFHYKQVG